MKCITWTIWAGILILIAFVSCHQTTNKTDEILMENVLSEQGLKEKIVVYQIFTRLFGNTNGTNIPYGTMEENGVGKFNDINDKALTSLAKMGVTHIWYTGVLEHAVMHDYSDYGIAIDNANVVKGRAGSPYAIKDYYDVDPDLATIVPNRMHEFDSLIQRTHDHGLKVLIDFVPNHVARQYHSDAKPEGIEDLGESDDTTQAFSPDNNFYYLPGKKFKVPIDYNPLGPNNTFLTEGVRYLESPAKATGNNIFKPNPGKDDWFETVKLNYGIDYLNDEKKNFDPIPKTWHMMYDILKYWTDKGVDGFRCDIVQLTPVEFWQWVIPKIKQINPEMLFIAEIYVPDQYRDYINQGGFDFLYDKVQMYDTLRRIMEGRGSTNYITRIWKDLRDINKNMIRFLENHDEQRLASEFFAKSPQPGIPGMIVSSLLYTGPTMVYFGQEVGEPGKGESGFSPDDGRTTIFDYWGVPEHQKWINQDQYDGGGLSEEQKTLRNFYSKLLRMSIKEPAFTKGKLFDIHQYNRKKHPKNYTGKQYAFIRFTEDQCLLIIANFETAKTLDFEVSIPPTAFEMLNIDKQKKYELTDQLDETVTASMKNGAVRVKLKPNSGHVFRIK